MKFVIKIDAIIQRDDAIQLSWHAKMMLKYHCN
jgi:hypothetical protein